MTLEINIEERKPIWNALSNFYLDNELQDFVFVSIASKIKASPYTFEEVKQINKEEVFPVLYSNLLSVAGNWTGFEEDWLEENILKKLHSKTFISKVLNDFRYRRMKWMFAEYWNRLEKACQEI